MRLYEVTKACLAAIRHRPSPRPLAWMLLTIPLLAGAAAATVVPGDTAPDFTLSDVNGVSYTLSAYRGKVVLLALVGWG